MSGSVRRLLCVGWVFASDPQLPADDVEQEELLGADVYAIAQADADPTESFGPAIEADVVGAVFGQAAGLGAQGAGDYQQAVEPSLRSIWCTRFRMRVLLCGRRTRCMAGLRSMGSACWDGPTDRPK